MGNTLSRGASHKKSDDPRPPKALSLPPRTTSSGRAVGPRARHLSLWQRARRSLLRPWYSFRQIAAEAFVWVLLPMLSSMATVSLLSVSASATAAGSWTALFALIAAPLPIFLCASFWMTLRRSLVSDRMDFVDRCPRCEHETVHGVVPWPMYMRTPLRRFRCRECGLYTRETVMVLHDLHAAHQAGFVRTGRDGWTSTRVQQYADAWVLDGRTHAQGNDQVWIRRCAVVDRNQQ